MADEDYLTGTEAVARAFHKHLRGSVLRVEYKDLPDGDIESNSPNMVIGRASVRLGNYVINFNVELVEGGGGHVYRVKDVSDAT